MTELYYQDLRKRVERMESKWLWAYPRVFGWVDSKGNVEIDDSQILVGIDLPVMAMMFKKKEEKAISKNLHRALADGEEQGGFAHAGSFARVSSSPNSGFDGPARACST